MIAYFDTSALVPLLVDEPSTSTCQELWEQADDVASSQLSFVEAAAALAQAHRIGRLDGRAHHAALNSLDQLDAELLALQVDQPLLRRAAELAREQQLRGYDAVHCATAELMAMPDLIVVAGDQALLRACSALGLVTADVNGRD